MKSDIEKLVNRLSSDALISAGVISWGAPVPAFGDASVSRIATLGINPSNREFVSSAGDELDGAERRFHTLRSLKISGWSEARECHYSLIEDSCVNYFHRNPYQGWFNSLQEIIEGTGFSYYSKSFTACHLDLSPYATSDKWTSLSAVQKRKLLSLTGDSLGYILAGSPVRILVLNGRTVVENFQAVSGQRLASRSMMSWSLPRSGGSGVEGVAYKGWVSSVAGVQLGRDILVLGYNHNIQSSFGVTRKVKDAISGWVARNAEEVIQ